MTNIKVGIVQQKCGASKQKNIEMSIEGIRKCVLKGAKLVVLQELHASTYFCQQESTNNFDLAESLPGPTYNKFAKIAKSLNVVLVTSLFEKRSAGLFHNTSVVFDKDGHEAGRHRKMHIPDDPGYYEKFYFTPGDLGFKSTKTKYAKIGSLICWDQWFPEAARLTVLKGAEILFYPTAIGWHPKEKKKFGKSQLDAWIIMQRSHAIANGVFVAAINRTGLEKIGNKKIQFWGNSMIIDPSGNIVARAKSEKEEILVCDINLSKIENVRNHWPFLRDRRIDYYKGLTKNPKDE